MEVVLKVWAYVLDMFKPLDISAKELFNIVSSDPLELFNIVKEVIKEYVKDIKNVKVRNIYLSKEEQELLIEYIVECELGEITLKIIHSENPSVTLQKYYEHCKRQSS